MRILVSKQNRRELWVKAPPSLPAEQKSRHQSRRDRFLRSIPHALHTSAPTVRPRSLPTGYEGGGGRELAVGAASPRDGQEPVANQD